MRKAIVPKKILLPLSFFLPFSLLMAEFAIQGISPFGERSLAILDAKEQYISFSAFLADILRSGDSLRYSWKLLLGGPMAGLLGYYLASPFELLFLLFPEEEYLAAYDIVIALKLALSGLTMALWLKEKKGIQPSSLLLSTAYALSGFTIVLGWCVMWLDSVYMLPLIALGLDRIAEGKRPFLYTISLGVAIIFNYYTGYMLCIFSVLYYERTESSVSDPLQRRYLLPVCFFRLLRPCREAPTYRLQTRSGNTPIQPSKGCTSAFCRACPQKRLTESYCRHCCVLAFYGLAFSA